MSPARSVINVGDSTRVVVSLRNLGADSVSVTTGGCPVLPYIAAQPSGLIVYPGGGSWGCMAELRRIAVLRRFTLAPGAEQAETLLVRGWASALAADPAVSLDRGRYLIYATLTAFELTLRSESVPLTVQ